MAKKVKPPEPAGESAPMWIVSFADLVTLLMSFFVVLYALKQSGAKQTELTAAIRKQFGYIPPDDSMDPVDLMVNQMLGRPMPPLTHNRGSADQEAHSTEGRHPEVTTVRAGKQVTSGGTINFDPGSIQLDADSLTTIAKIADIVRGHNNVLEVKGHVTPDEIALRSDDGMSLSYQRAVAVCDQLVKLGIDRRVLRPVACGAFEPLKVGVYDAAGLKQNRRVDVCSTDVVASDFFPATYAPATPGDSAKPAEDGKTGDAGKHDDAAVSPAAPSASAPVAPAASPAEGGEAH